MDHIQNQILCIHDPKHFFTTDPKTVTTASGNSKQFQYIEQLFDNTAHIRAIFEPEAWIKRSILFIALGW